jgi:hypothetical protein
MVLLSDSSIVQHEVHHGSDCIACMLSLLASSAVDEPQNVGVVSSYVTN